ncbi:glycosyltransferase [Formosa sp. PL04]|uniref:glycosyltransferase n=1 Tax=Formosa sp. PL04 TaxID=3081755 RepID=UPI002980EF5F|nr:glycosyltransferase [Formosa sp. PL04]MDW5290733.1 glycosyltransferase [Formosa sp. PL04]
MKLAIISHTEHYTNSDGQIVGWGPTISELNHLLDVFDTIYHVAMYHDIEAPPSALPYVSDRIIFVPLPALGGQTLGAKLQLLWKSPKVIQIIHTTLKQVDYFQFRGPTGIGVYVIPFLTLCIHTPGWFKYAGNWNQDKPPIGYRLQRWMLKKQSRTVTINGSWKHQPEHCLTFENPCLTDAELIEGAKLGSQKVISGELTCCFVGRLEKPKGVERLIKGISGLKAVEKQRIKAVHLVGDGPDKAYFKTLAEASGVHFVFHGFLSRADVFNIYKKSQVFLMPTTASEGFPKVIAEAMNYGCIPVVSDISSIGQYIINLQTGICLEAVTPLGVQSAMRALLKMTDAEFNKQLVNQRTLVGTFSFNYYNHRIESEIITNI